MGGAQEDSGHQDVDARIWKRAGSPAVGGRPRAAPLEQGAALTVAAGQSRGFSRISQVSMTSPSAMSLKARLIPHS